MERRRGPSMKSSFSETRLLLIPELVDTLGTLGYASFSCCMPNWMTM